MITIMTTTIMIQGVDWNGHAYTVAETLAGLSIRLVRALAPCTGSNPLEAVHVSRGIEHNIHRLVPSNFVGLLDSGADKCIITITRVVIVVSVMVVMTITTKTK